MRYLVSAVACMLLVCATSAARAAVVNPGQTVPVGVDAPDFVLPTGEIVAQDTQTFLFEYDLTGSGFTAPGPTSFNGTVTSQVLRDTATGKLTFIYQVETDAQGETYAVGREGATFLLNSFAGFGTDITANRDYTVTRSADGATITGNNGSPGDSLLPHFFIVTDASEFDTSGSFSGTAETELSVVEDETQIVTGQVFNAAFSIPGTFQPIADDGGGNGGNVIPLPAGVWLGLVALAGGGACAKARRRIRFG